ncbi:MAG TPA: YidC/Oxa1 family membrane protein insertase [Chloroflexota bacterium]
MQNIFSFIIHPMELGIVWLATSVGSAGIGIILFTIFVRLLLSPLQIAQLRNAKAMQRLQPLMQELRQKHGKDKQKMSEETMKLYREHNVNPAMGCLPTLLQFPILIGLFYALLHLGSSPPGYPQHLNWATVTCNSHPAHTWTAWLSGCYSVSGWATTPYHVFQLFHANFLWLSNGLGSPDPLYILPILAGITQWVQSRMMLTQSVDPQQQMMNNLMNFMPLMIVFFALRYASGLSLYWVTSTLIGIAIQYKITGWGLLPETIGHILAPLRGGSAPGGTRSTGATRKPSGSARSSPPKQAAQRLTSSNGKSQNGTPVSNGADVPANGSDGAGEAAGEKTAVVRPRKKANRARGGRGGGRRG